MDERELESLFSTVPGDAPPPAFTRGDVVAESKRQTLRRRNRIAGGGAAAVVVLAGLGVFGLYSDGSIGTSSGKSDTAVSANSAPVAGQPGPGSERPLAGGDSPNFPGQTSQQGGEGPGKTGQTAEGTPGCEKVDGKLATALAGELPVHVAISEAIPGGACTTGALAAGFHVPGGTISAAVFPKGSTPVFAAQPVTAVRQTAVAHSGATVVVVSTPDAGPDAPYSDRILLFAVDIGRQF